MALRFSKNLTLPPADIAITSLVVKNTELVANAKHEIIWFILFPNHYTLLFFVSHELFDDASLFVVWALVGMPNMHAGLGLLHPWFSRLLDLIIEHWYGGWWLHQQQVITGVLHAHGRLERTVVSNFQRILNFPTKVQPCAPPRNLGNCCPM